MKDTIITAQMKRRELMLWLACFAVANVVNWVTIIKFATPWYEVFTQLGYVVVLSFVIYALIGMVRLAWWILNRTFRK
ncbi:MAG: hypothetical protein IIY05_03870 [Alistipes sp.]|nr:hypothetical protein [Alistipes sp.]